MRRIAIIGVGGAGKSRLATLLGERTGLPVIHLDRHFWRPGWVETPPAEWRAAQLELLDVEHPDGWIADGNYGGTMDIRLERADTVVFLDPPTLVALRRAVVRDLFGGARYGAPPDGQRVDLDFLRWISRYRRDRRPGVLERLRVFEGQVHHLRTRREVQAFLAAIPPQRDGHDRHEADGPGDGDALGRVPPLRR